MKKYKITFNKPLDPNFPDATCYEYESSDLVQLAVDLQDQFRTDQLDELQKIEVISEFSQE